MSSEEDALYPCMPRAKEAVSYTWWPPSSGDHKANNYGGQQPDASIVVVKGQDFEVMWDAEGICKAMKELYAKSEYQSSLKWEIKVYTFNAINHYCRFA